MKRVDGTAKIHQSVEIGDFSVIKKGVTIGAGSIIGSNVVLYDGTIIGENVRIDDNSVIGKQPMKAITSAVSSDDLRPSCVIGNNVIIGTSTVIYAGSIIEDFCFVADLASIREDVVIGNSTIIGRGVAIENYCNIGSYCKIQTNAYITAYSRLEDFVFIAPGVVTSNDNFVGRSKERLNKFKGPTIKKGARIGAQATILPGKIIEEDALVAAGSVITKDVKTKKVVIGSPAREIREVPSEQLLENQ